MNLELDIEKIINYHISEAIEVKIKFLENNPIEEIAQILIKVIKSGNKILTCGNGGSSCDAMHFAEELVGRYKRTRSPIRALSLTDSSTLTCIANDFGYDKVFSRQVEAQADKGDVLVTITTSGNSINVINAAKEAKKKGVKVIGFLGKTGGEIKDLCDITLIVPSDSTERIQEIHMLSYHILMELIENILYPEK